MYKILTAGDPAWDACLDALPPAKRDVYYTSGYCRLYELNGDGEALMFLYESGGNVGIYPFMKNRIKGYDLDGEYYDAQTAYGYGGPLVSDESSAFSEEFESAFLDYARGANIVAEFIRFHPVLGNESLFRERLTVEKNRATALIDLTGGADGVFNRQMDAKCRNQVRKALNSGLGVSWGYSPDAFKALYADTMRMNNADGYYFFNDAYFERCGDIPFFHTVNITRGGALTASGMFMALGRGMHYHLSGRDPAYSACCTGHMMIWEAVKYACENGCEYMHLGGGLSDAPDDKLFGFKKQFSKTFLTFYIGKRVINERAYGALIEEWSRRSGLQPRMFLAYNFE